MPRKRVLTFLAIFATLSSSESLADGYPLFENNDTLELVLDVPMRTLLRRAKKNPILDGKLHFLDFDGRDVTIDLTITTRGKSRLAHCSFPPLSITLDREQTAATVYAGQRKLKIVTHCRSGSTYERYFYQEYGIYRAYNLLTDHSFRVRMLDVTFRDNEQKRRDQIVAAFFIESDGEVAERLGMTKIQSKTIDPNQFNVVETSKFELFQYMIANTDWAILKGPGSEDCCHNGKVIGNVGADVNWVVLPYDFDQAGIINTKYALPSLRFNIKTVRVRLYRGRCHHNEQLAETIELFNERRNQLETAMVPQVLSDRSQRSALKYLDEFFTTINDSKRLQKKVIDVCRGR